MAAQKFVEDGMKPARARSWLDAIALFFGTGFYSGSASPYFATVGALLGVPLAIALHAWLPSVLQALVIAVLILVSVPICQRSAIVIGRKDPREVVLDEIVTIPIVYLFVPVLSVPVLIAGFLLHRVFDITKILGINQLQHLPGGWGIVADDILAGIYASFTLHLLLYFHIIA